MWSLLKSLGLIPSRLPDLKKSGGVARRALLALGAACAIACGGFVNVGAAETVDVTTGGSTATVYTKEGTESYVQTNTYTKKQTYTQEQVKKLINDLKTGDVATNKDNITTLKGKTVGLSTDGKSLNGMNSVETGALTVTGQISNGADVTTTLTAIDASMKQTDTNKTDITTLKTKTTQISYADGDGTNISGVTIKDGNIIGNGHSAITQLANVETDKIKTDSINGKSLTGTTVATEKEVKDVADAVKKETDARTEADKALDEKITKNSQNIAMLNENGVKYDTDVKDKITLAGLDGTKITRLKDAALNDSSTDAVTGRQLNKTNEDLAAEVTARTNKDTKLEEKITKNSGDITDLNAKDIELAGKIQTNADNIQNNKKDITTIKQRTAGIDRIDATKETTIEGHVTVDNLGNVKAKGNVTADGKLTGKGVDAGDGAITTKGAVNAGSLSVTDASHLKGDVTMDKTLSVTGDTSLGALNVTGESSLKNTQVNGTLTTTGKATFKEAVDMDKGLTVTSGDTSLQNTDVKGALNVTGESSLKDTQVNGTLGVIGATTLSGELTAEKDATFEKDVTVKGTTNLKNTTVTGDLKVTGTITTDTMVFGVKPTNYTEIDQGKVTSKNSYINGAGQSITSSSTFDVEKNEVGFVNNATGEQSYHKQTSDVIMDNVKDGKNSNNRTQTKTETKNIITDENRNSSTTSQTASENKTYLKDKDGKNTNSTIDTAKGYDKTIKGENGKTSTTQDELNITNTAKDGTITNEAQNIVNKAATMDTTVTGKATESYGVLETTVTGQATQNFNGGLNTTVTGAENHTVTGTQTNTVGGGQINNITGGQTNNILTGDQKTTVSGGSIINKAENGNISNTAKNVTNVGTESVTNTVGANEVKVSQDGVDIKADADKTIKESVGADTSRTMTDGRIIDKAGDMTVTTDKTTGTTFGNGTPKDITVINGGTIGTNKVNANETNTKKLTAGAAADADGGRLTVDADGVKGSYKSGDYTSRSYILANTLKSGVDNGKEPIDADFVGSRTDHYMEGNKAKLDETVKDADGSNVTKKTSTKTYTEIKDTNGNTLSVNQKADGNNYKLEDQDGNTNHVTNSATQSKQTLKDKNGNTLTTNQTATKNNFDLKSADGSKENHTTNTVDESRVAIKGENGKAELSTTDEGTTFKHSAAKEAFTEGGATNTTIKGNTITTGKVTMDYADVMKDLGVYGNARVDKDMTVKGNTTLGEAGKDTTLTVNSKATFNENATFEKGAEVKNGLTVSSGGLNVTGESTFNDKVTMKNGLDVTGGVASDSFTVKGTDIKIDSSGINAGGTVISNVADGSISEGSKDAVNGGQLYQVKNDLEGKVNKVGANAAAMANLHPMEFDPDSKWNIAAAMGNYGSETATAIGAFYRPNEDVMVNFSTAFGTGENMVGGGVSVRLGKGSNKLSRQESNALKAQVNDLTARMDALLSVLNPNMSKDFPDVPENHWAYEAVSRLAGNDIVQGYPDGEFHGDRTMTRYEMAEIIYNALSRGAEAERELVEEFKPELQAMAASEKATAERAEG